MTSLSAASALRRFLILTALRWLPTGLLIPVLVLLPLSRGLSLSELGLAGAMQGLVVFALELPTGGLADAVGRRRVLLSSTAFAVLSTGLFLVADSFATFAVVFAFQGIYRALDSGPLESWYVDTALNADPSTPVEKGMSAYGTVLGMAIAAGSLVSGLVIGLDPLQGVDALMVPVILAVVMQLLSLLVLALLMVETHPASGLRHVARSALATPRTIADGVGLLRHSPVLLALVAVELFWGFGMICFEGLMPVRLAEVAGSADSAAAITGPAGAAAWIASAAGSAIMPWLGRWIGIAPAAALMRVLQGIAVAGMGFFAGVAGILLAYLASNAVHGTSNAAHMTLLHRQAVGSVRTTVVSLNSMVSQPASALGLIVLTALADATSITNAMYVGAAILAVAAPLYLPAWLQTRPEQGHMPDRPAAPCTDHTEASTDRSGLCRPDSFPTP
jgi:MFS family permease